MEKKRIHIILDKDIHDRFKIEAIKRNESISSLIRKLVLGFLDYYDSIPGEHDSDIDGHRDKKTFNEDYRD